MFFSITSSLSFIECLKNRNTNMSTEKMKLEPPSVFNKANVVSQYKLSSSQLSIIFFPWKVRLKLQSIFSDFFTLRNTSTLFFLTERIPCHDLIMKTNTRAINIINASHSPFKLSAITVTITVRSSRI